MAGITVDIEHYDRMMSQLEEYQDIINEPDADNEEDCPDSDVDVEDSHMMFDIKSLICQPGKCLSRDQRLIVQFLRYAGPGMTPKEITQRYGFSRHQIHRATQSEHPTPQKRKRPTKLQDFQVADIVKYIRQSFENRSRSYRFLAEGPFKHLQVSHATIRRSLESIGYRRYVSIRQTIISDANKAKRLQFARDHVSWTADDWSKVLFSDETWVKGEAHRKIRVTRLPGELYEPTCLRSAVQRRPGWMFWGSVYGLNKGPCLTWDKKWGSIRQSSYQEHIVPLVSNFINAHPELLFQQDNAPAHVGSTLEVLKSLDISNMIWPPSSPDLNPIEKCWSWMKDYVQAQVGDRGINRMSELQELVHRSWETAVTRERLQKELDKMPRKMEAVIAAGGGHIEEFMKRGIK